MGFTGERLKKKKNFSHGNYYDVCSCLYLIGYSVCVEKNACKQVKCLFSDLFEICAL